jgi:hypothetical protein
MLAGDGWRMKEEEEAAPQAEKLPHIWDRDRQRLAGNCEMVVWCLSTLFGRKSLQTAKRA